MAEKLSEALERVLAGRGFTDGDAAPECGVSRQTFGKWRRGESLPQVRRYTRLAVFLGVTIRDVSKMVRASREQPEERVA